jgi:abhydrolase domain-containing protein 1/3
MEPIVEADDTDDDAPSRVWSVSSSAMNLDAEDEELVKWATKVYGRGDFGRDGDASSKDDDSPRSPLSENEGKSVDFTADTADTPAGGGEPARESPTDDSSEKGGGDNVTPGHSARGRLGRGSIFTSKDVRRQTVVITKKVMTSVASVSLGLGYLAYLRVRHRESLNDPNACHPFVVHGDKALTRELLARCPSLRREYELPKWCTNTHAQTLIGYGRMFTIFLEYDRQLVRCADGGQVGLDWLVKARFTPPARPPTSPEDGASRAVTAANIPAACDLPDDAPVFIMLHGINGGSHEGPSKWAVATGAVRGWRCVALNLRGCNGVPLSSAKVYCAASAEDVRAAVNAARIKYPSAPILLAGYSLGTYVIATYLAEENSGGRDPVAGAVLVSCPMDPHTSHAGLNRVPGLVYNGAITAELRRYYRKHADVVGHVGGKGFSAKLIRDFERELIVATHG